MERYTFIASFPLRGKVAVREAAGRKGGGALNVHLRKHGGPVLPPQGEGGPPRSGWPEGGRCAKALTSEEQRSS
jgi:hypothetical protein